ncbi:hypothetical protein BH11GEM2_BH11GEM2_09520 [soil metagenome]
MRNAFVVITVLAALAAECRAQVAATASSTIILVRHVEKGAEPAADPPLTMKGALRSAAFVGFVKDVGIAVVVTTQYVRPRGTGAPVAASLAITPEVLDARLTSAATRDSILARHRGRPPALRRARPPCVGNAMMKP